MEDAVPTTLNKQAWATMNYGNNYPKFMVSLLKATFGAAAHQGQRVRLSWLPSWMANYSWLYIFDDMYRGQSCRRRRQ